jgi:hypothetical protein
MLSRSRRVVENAFGILSQKFRIYQGTLQSLPENVDNNFFVTFILHSYLRDQGPELTDMVSSANDQSNLTKIRRLKVFENRVLRASEGGTDRRLEKIT